MRALIVLLIACAIALPATAAEKMKAEDVIAAHLKSLGAANPNTNDMREFTGKAEVRMRAATGLDGGEALVLSQGRNLKFSTRFGTHEYPGEQIVCDGEKVQAEYVKPGVRSVLGDFLYLQPVLVKEGLFGGTLVSGWALNDLASRGAKIKYDGLKKVNGRELHQITYTPKKVERLSVKLFFAPDTFQHVRSVYVLTIQPPPSDLQSTITPSISETRALESRFILEERFDDFREANGMTLPSKWTIAYEAETDRLPSDFSIHGAGTSDNGGGKRSSWIWTVVLTDFRMRPPQ